VFGYTRRKGAVETGIESVEYQELDSLIDSLEQVLDLHDNGSTDWRPVWDIIKTIGAEFKGARYPTRDAQQAAWNRKQGLIEQVKKLQEADFAKRRQFNEQSAEHRDTIMRIADNAKSDNGLGDVALFLVTGGLSHIGKQLLEAVFGETDEVKEELDRRSSYLKDAGSYFSQNKGEMKRSDKDTAYEHMNEIRDALNADWEEWKHAKSTAYEARQEARVEKRERWEASQREFIEMLEAKNERLEEVLSHKREHLEKLQDMKSTARGDFEDRVDGWIDQDETAISEIEAKIESNEVKIREVREKLE
jgi:hypothetical protein